MKRKILKRVVIGLAVLGVLILSLMGVIMYCVPVTMIRVDSELKFVNEYNPDALLCFAAAYTNQDGSIEGEYRIDGKTYGTPSRKERISLHPTKGMIISGQWHADNGFQQTVLVKAYKARKYDDNRKRIRRALCTESSTSPCYFIIQSTRRMTLNEFAEECRKYCYHAVNLDMGEYAYGWNGKKINSIWAYFTKDKQTNWICVE